jgi:undecaprenyl diphosphate synthase
MGGMIVIKDRSSNKSLSKTLNHLGIIMDGNRRYAIANKLSINQGHLAGAQNAIKIIEACKKQGIKEVSLYTFSTENWRRSKQEINFIFTQFKKYLIKYQPYFLEHNIRIRVIGERKGLNEALIKTIVKIENLTSKNQELIVNLLFNYGGESDLEHGLKKMKNPTLKALRAQAYSHSLSDVDLLIRTGGEQRISNFLPLQIAYSELYFSPVYWPDFKESHLIKAIKDFAKRQRRYGGD